MAENKPRVFTRTRERDGKPMTRLAHTAADAVALEFAGWTEVDGTEATRTVAAVEREAKTAAAEAAKTDPTKK